MNNLDNDDDQDMDEDEVAEALRAALPPNIFSRVMAMLAKAGPEETDGETDEPVELEYGDRARRRAKDNFRSGLTPSARAMDAASSNRHSAGFAARFPGARQPKQEGGVV